MRKYAAVTQRHTTTTIAGESSQPQSMQVDGETVAPLALIRSIRCTHDANTGTAVTVSIAGHSGTVQEWTFTATSGATESMPDATAALAPFGSVVKVSDDAAAAYTYDLSIDLEVVQQWGRE